mmetsp:Transcript_11231/g.25479  ORF Transcript_11231/g.25479 Transcript_11231/m.25479 type:complete len:108 (-) Transcript_11231:11-334(-)|eukprot:246508-Hanusia_phi.AAC.1
MPTLEDIPAEKGALKPLMIPPARLVLAYGEPPAKVDWFMAMDGFPAPACAASCLAQDWSILDQEELRITRGCDGGSNQCQVVLQLTGRLSRNSGFELVSGFRSVADQ